MHRKNVPGFNLGLVVTFCDLGREVLETHGSSEGLADSAKVWSQSVGLFVFVVSLKGRMIIRVVGISHSA